MGRRIQDGFEIGTRNSAWSLLASGASQEAYITSSPSPRTGTYAAALSAYVNRVDYYRMFRFDLATAISEVWVRIGAYITLGGSVMEVALIRFFDSAGAIQGLLTYKVSNNTLNYYVGNRVVSLGSYSTARNAWHSIKVYIKPLNSGGALSVFLNGTEVITVASGDTQQTGNANIRYVDVGIWGLVAGDGDNYYYVYFDDIAINDNAGSYQNGMMGDGGIILLKPSGNGNYSQLVGSDGNSTDNYLLVDEVPPSATDYVGSATAGEKDTYAMGDVPGTYNAVVLVKQVINASLASTGTGSIRPLLRAGGVDYADSDIALPVGYANYELPIRYVHPDGSAWTTANLNAIEAGQEVV